jgi:hypothetical protein
MLAERGASRPRDRIFAIVGRNMGILMRIAIAMQAILSFPRCQTWFVRSRPARNPKGKTRPW